MGTFGTPPPLGVSGGVCVDVLLGVDVSLAFEGQPAVKGTASMMTASISHIVLMELLGKPRYGNG
jgi:hypothetical protein